MCGLSTAMYRQKLPAMIVLYYFLELLHWQPLSLIAQQHNSNLTFRIALTWSRYVLVVGGSLWHKTFLHLLRPMPMHHTAWTNLVLILFSLLCILAFNYEQFVQDNTNLVANPFLFDLLSASSEVPVLSQYLHLYRLLIKVSTLLMSKIIFVFPELERSLLMSLSKYLNFFLGCTFSSWTNPRPTFFNLSFLVSRFIF